MPREGHLIAFSSARAENAMTRFVQAVKPDIIISNGGAIGKIIHKELLSAETACKIIAMCQQYTNGKGLITVETDDGSYCNYHPDDPDCRNNYQYTDFVDFKKTYMVASELERERRLPCQMRSTK